MWVTSTLRNRLSATKVLCRHRFLSLYKRPPIISVLGHVDHGKTTLIDNLRKTNNVSLEAGGITQRNSVFQHTIPESNFKFTIVDTPGHAAFTKMRIRGAVLTDIAILVVAATEGIKQQTIECIRLLKKNHLPIVVALNKIDLPNADVSKCLEQLFDHGIETEQVGGNIKAVPISALRDTNVPELMSAVQSVANTLDLNTPLDRAYSEGVVFDMNLGRGGNVYTTVIVKNGSFKQGDAIISSTNFKKTMVKKLTSMDGTQIDEALPGMPVVMFGHSSNSLPDVGSNVAIFDKRKIKDIKNYIDKSHDMNQILNNIQGSESNLEDKLKKKISYLVCADTVGSLELLKDMLNVNNDGILMNVFHGSIKNIPETMLQLAESINAQIVLFNVESLHRHTPLVVHHHNIIYDMATSIEDELNEIFPMDKTEKILGTGFIKQIHGTKKQPVFGIKLNQSGAFHKSALYKIKRRGLTVWQGRINSLKYMKTSIEKTDPTTMPECGIGLPKVLDLTFLPNDNIICYKEEWNRKEILDKSFFGTEEDSVNSHRN